MTGRVARRMQASSEQPRRGIRFIHRDTVVAAPLDETFAFFADASNLERLTPPWLNFTIQTPLPLVMRQGAEIRYAIRLYGVPIPWLSRIELWEPNVAFVDRQIVGPYLWWRHEHRFESARHGTRVIDDVTYVPRWRWLSQWLVQRDLERIFTYRQQALVDRFSPRRARVLPVSSYAGR
jgi:ligand-binding SRPBCC domain-containing protein